MMNTKPYLFTLLLGTAFAVTSHASILFSDDFTDNDRTVNPTWYALNTPIAGQSGGVLSLGGSANSHKYVMSNFTGATLAVGDQLTLSFRVKMTLPSAQNRNRELVFAVGNNRGTLVTSDGGEVPNYNDDLGYMATLGLGTGFSAIARDAGTLSFLGRTWNATDHTQLGADTFGMNPTDSFKDYTMTLERTASGLDISLTDGTTSVSFSDNAVPSNDFYTFNMVSVGFYNRHVDNTMDVDSISVTYTAVPEPATTAILMGLLAFGAILVRRRSRR